jgi:hypothetical protein
LAIPDIVTQAVGIFRHFLDIQQEHPAARTFLQTEREETGLVELTEKWKTLGKVSISNYCQNYCHLPQIDISM